MMLAMLRMPPLPDILSICCCLLFVVWLVLSLSDIYVVCTENIILRASHRNDLAYNDNADNPLFVGIFGDGCRHSGVGWAEYTKPIQDMS